MVMGRTYDAKVLDMFEFGIEDYKPMEAFKGNEIEKHLKPILIFQGE